MSLLDSSSSAFTQILDNGVLSWGLFACGFAQVSKLVYELIRFQRWRPGVLIETGGMPSSHSALMTGTAAGIGFELGFDNPDFALASVLAFIVMYDASGIRRSAGLTAARVNLLADEVLPKKPETNLKESLGHTRLEVLVGSIIGPCIVLPGLFFVGSPLDIFHLVWLNLG